MIFAIISLVTAIILYLTNFFDQTTFKILFAICIGLFIHFTANSIIKKVKIRNDI